MTEHKTKLNFTSESDKMKGWGRPQHNVLPIIACKNLAFNQRRCVESVGNLVWALTRTANYSKQGKFVPRVWEDAVEVQSKVRTLNHNLFCSEAESFFPSMLKSPWNFASSEAWLPTDWLAVYISHIKTGFQLILPTTFNRMTAGRWNVQHFVKSSIQQQKMTTKLRKPLCTEKGKFLNWLTVWILRIYCSVISFKAKIVQKRQSTTNMRLENLTL